jgi:hypothetical protein
VGPAPPDEVTRGSVAVGRSQPASRTATAAIETTSLIIGILIGTKDAGA